MTLCPADKPKIVAHVLAQLAQELDNCIEAANSAHLAAVDDQSVAETQYDTLAIESAYLAEGQSKRLLELKKTSAQLASLSFPLADEPATIDQPIKLGALIQLDDFSAHDWLFLSPSAGGYKVKISEHTITLVTPHSPLGKALLNKYLDDDVQYQAGNKVINKTISHHL